MKTIDLDPFWRTTIGFDRLLDLVDRSLGPSPQDTYPPFDIIKAGEDSYRIVLAVAGFTEDQLSLTVDQNTLLVSGKIDPAEDQADYLYRGLARQSFERRFSLADYVQVSGASLRDGVLEISLRRELPEAMKPRRIAITTAPGLGREQREKNFTTIEHKAA
jgi:molecular chaperone IbpA